MIPGAIIDTAHRLNEVELAHHETGWLRYVPVYTAGLGTAALGIAAADLVHELNEGPEEVVIVGKDGDDHKDAGHHDTFCLS
ncbi:hypothetical protein [Rhodoligotrophos ferricapiens]|uniref:hypothetical protein n=1 Tax=Rhodoligotrophos ferricapiens TaxID=3069264 RepID=UPI00315D2160